MSITNGTARPEILDKTFLLALQEQALEKLIISVDSMDAAIHDRLRGKQGALQRTLENLDRYIQLGFPVKVQMTVCLRRQRPVQSGNCYFFGRVARLRTMEPPFCIQARKQPCESYTTLISCKK